MGAENYAVWAATIRRNLRTARLWGYVDGSITSKDGSKEDSIVSCTQTWGDIDEIVMGYIFRSVDPSVCLDLLESTTSRAQWTYLTKRYVQSSGAREYQLRSELDSLRQGELSIQEFFGRLRRIWSELDAMHVSGRVSTCSCGQQRDRQQLYHFLIRLRPDFEALRAQLLHRSPLPSLDDALTELIAEETRLRALGTPVTPSETVFAPVSRPPSSEPSTSILDTPRTSHVMDSLAHSGDGTLTSLYCKYCRNRGHTIDQCRKRQRKERQRQLRTTAAVVDSSTPLATASPAGSPDVNQLASDFGF
ncbi:hypothetical protein Taro_005932 [Colocasia esculenta]|uniref:Retrotransposon Copia-like N-terminal domain-containing protein n=1 Tax=Colocasia esculenta TaxID=4460 RepID=A0A843TVY6_COLES|nr:hypothetical protein [Colocasia esculenta]